MYQDAILQIIENSFVLFLK